MSKARELGASLLSSKQARDDKFRKRQESFQKRQAWTELLLPPVIDAGTRAIAENALKKDRELFSSDPNAMAIASSFELANRYGGEILKTKEAIDSFGGTPSDYAYNKYAAPFMAGAERELQLRGDYDLIGDAGPFKASVDKQLRILSDEWAADFNKAFDALQGTGTPEERAARISELSKTINPNKFSDVIFKKIKSVFGKTSKEELDAQAMDDLMNSPLYKNTSNFNEFKKEFDETKDIFSSYEMANLELGNFDPENLSFTETVTENRVSTEGTLVTETFTVSTNRNTGKETKTMTDRQIIDIRPEDTEEEITANFFKVSVDLFDLASDTLNSDALRAFSERAKAKKIQYTNPRSIEEYNKLQKILEEVIVLENAIKDPSKEAIANSLVTQIGVEGLALENLILSLSDDADERTAAQNRILQIFNNQLDFRDFITQNLKGVDEFPGQE